jgi:hypothetical protein
MRDLFISSQGLTPLIVGYRPFGTKCLFPDSQSMIRDYEDSFSVGIGMAIALEDLSVSDVVEIDFEIENTLPRGTNHGGQSFITRGGRRGRRLPGLPADLFPARV